MEVEVEWSTPTPIMISLVDFLIYSFVYVDGEAVKMSWEKCEMESKFTFVIHWQ